MTPCIRAKFKKAARYWKLEIRIEKRCFFLALQVNARNWRFKRTLESIKVEESRKRFNSFALLKKEDDSYLFFPVTWLRKSSSTNVIYFSPREPKMHEKKNTDKHFISRSRSPSVNTRNPSDHCGQVTTFFVELVVASFSPRWKKNSI